ncbi:MAG TPA: carboxypeptidase-like regulatory domain-containing protein [Gemmatimonadales bacterium]|nr:carboxypeptidase-like regulatory domain-containing protein [Gemmatimonadales bacterium]
MTDRLDSCLVPRVLALLVSCGPGLVGAQAIRTTLLGAGTHQPVAGAFVILLDSAGREVVRTLTDENGRVRLDVRPGAYRVSVLRIGMARWSGKPLLLAAGDTITTPIEAPEIPVLLSEIAVHAERRCRVRPEEGSAAARLWEEARTALEATEWTIAHPVYRFQTRRYVRTFGPSGNRPIEDQRYLGPGNSAWPFRSLPAESLAARGFAQLDSEGAMTYYGPDLPVFLSAVFLAQHCYRVEQPKGDTADPRIGLGFEPVERGRQVDVAGVLWLDRRSSELRELLFHYTNLGGWAGRGAQGRVVFDRLPNGAWVIRRWSIRMPIPRVVTRQVNMPGVAAAAAPVDTVGIAGYREEGGLVTEVRTATGQLVATYPDEP